MLRFVFAFIVIISIICAVFTGTLPSLSGSVMDGAARAVTVTISLLGAMCLWSGVLEVLREAGVLRGLTRALRPILRFVFPDAAKKDSGLDEIAAAISANILGMGNAATPMALRAMEAMAKNSGGGDSASDDMVTFAVISTASFALFPTTVISLRAASGSPSAFAVIIPVWITSSLGMAAAVFFSKILRFWGNKKRERRAL